MEQYLLNKSELLELAQKAFAFDACQWGGIDRHWPQYRLIINRYKNKYLADRNIEDKDTNIIEMEIEKWKT